MADRLLTVEELAEYLRVPVKTVYTWRYHGEGPRGAAVGRYVRFRLSDVDAWIDAHSDQKGSRR